MTEIVCWCDRCGTELLAGTFCYRFGSSLVCEDCLTGFAREYFRFALEVIG